MKPRIQVYFNSACPVCNAGITNQKKKQTTCDVDWQDVHLNSHTVKLLNADLEYVRERLHVIDIEGQTRIGYEAFITIWENTPSEHWKANISKVPVLRWILNVSYDLFAHYLYKWNRSKNHW